jgi:opacity protein-like surface antigen
MIGADASKSFSTAPGTAAIGRRWRMAAALAMVVWAVAPRDAVAQGFISPSVGYNFGGDTGCLSATNCEDKNWNLGVGVGALGSVVGFEFEVMYEDTFFGETESQATSLLTMMGNFMLAPKFGPVQPYGLVGVGLMKTSLETVGNLAEDDQSQIGWDIGGGLMIFFGRHVGVRGDLRYYHSFEVFDLFGFELPGGEDKLDFGRASFGMVFKF